MNIAGAVILYHPSLSVISNIKTYLPFLNFLYVYDNTEIKNELLHQQLRTLDDKIIIIHDGENKGIAARLNAGAKSCLIEKCNWLLTMDQDSGFTGDDLKRYISCIEIIEEKNNVAMFGINYEKEDTTNDCNYREATRLITSGSILNVSLFKYTKGFDEAMFIDEVDTDYCYNSIIKGYRIVKFENIFLNHSLGEISYHTSLKTLKKTSRTLHSPIRLYYMVRNYFYINKKYPHAFLKEKKIRKIDLLNRIKNNFLYGDNKINLLNCIFSGWIDFKKNKLGKKIINDFTNGYKK